MPKLLKSIFLFSFLFFLCSTFAFAVEEISITTYYPSPYGSYKNLEVYNTDESTTQTDFTQGITKAGLLITTEYTANAYTPGVFWKTSNNNATKPKAGIYLMETGTGTRMYLGTSNNYGTGITNSAVVINESGDVGVSGGVKLGTSSTCGSSTAGTVRYNSGTSVVEYCNGTSWTTLGGTQVNRGNCTVATGGTCTATCPSGYTIVTGGGCMGTQGPGYCNISASYPSGSGWVCGGSCSNAMFSFNGYVICAK